MANRVEIDVIFGPGLNRSVDSAQDKIDGFGKKTQTVFTKLDAAIGSFAGNLAANLVQRGLDLVADGFRATINEVIEFEKALVAVQKTTNLSQIGLNELGQRIDEISARTPVSANELLNLASVAGQLGVRGVDNLAKFAETISQLNVATDLAGEEGARQLIRILNITGEGAENIDRFGAAVVELGNNFAATESEITRVATEVARSTSQFNLSSAEVVGLSTAIKSLGIQAQLGGSAVGRAFREIEESIRVGGVRLERLVQLTGMTGEELEKTFKDDALSVFDAFISGLGEASRSGESIAAILETVGLKGDEINKVLPVLAQRFEIVSDAVETSNQAFKDNTALAEESERAFNTLGSQIDQFGQNLLEVSRNVLGPFGVVLKDTLEGANVLLKTFRTNTENSTTSIEDLNRQISELKSRQEELNQVIETAPEQSTLFKVSKFEAEELESSIKDLILRRKELSEQIQKEPVSLIRPEQNNFIDRLNKGFMQLNQNLVMAQDNAPIDLFAPEQVQPELPKPLDAEEEDPRIKNEITTNEKIIQARQRLNAELTRIREEQKLLQEEREIEEQVQQEEATEEDFERLSQIEQKKFEIRRNFADSQLELIQDSKQKELQAEVNAAKQEQDILKQRIESQRRFNKAKAGLERRQTDASVGFAKAAGDAIIALTGDNQVAALALEKGFAVADILIADARARAGAFASTAAIPFPGNLSAFATLQGIISQTTALSLATVAAQTVAQAARFQEGGFVPGSSFTGDNVLVRANSGEFIVNRRQQENILEAVANGGASNNGELVEEIQGLREDIQRQPVVVQIGERQLANAVRDARTNGRL